MRFRVIRLQTEIILSSGPSSVNLSWSEPQGISASLCTDLLGVGWWHDDSSPSDCKFEEKTVAQDLKLLEFFNIWSLRQTWNRYCFSTRHPEVRFFEKSGLEVHGNPRKFAAKEGTNVVYGPDTGCDRAANSESVTHQLRSHALNPIRVSHRSAVTAGCQLDSRKWMTKNGVRRKAGCRS